MLRLNCAVSIGGQIRSTGWHVHTVTVTDIKTPVVRGDVTILQKPGGAREVHQWKATFVSRGNWKIEGYGARMGRSGDRVPNAATFPFSLDPLINQGITVALSGWLTKEMGDLPLDAAAAPAEEPRVVIVEPPAALLTNGASKHVEPTVTAEAKEPPSELRIMIERQLKGSSGLVSGLIKIEDAAWKQLLAGMSQAERDDFMCSITMLKGDVFTLQLRISEAYREARADGAD